MRQIKFYLKYPVIFIFVLLASKAAFAQEAILYELNDLEFQGNSYFSSSILSDVIISKQTPSWLSKSANMIYYKLGRKPSYFDSLLIQEDLDILRYYYQDNGFFKMRAGFSFNLDKNTKNAGLYYTIDEGPHFVIRKHQITGLEKLPLEIYSKITDFRIDSAEYFSKARLDEKNSQVITFLRDNGFMLARVEVPQVDVYPDSGFVDLKVHAVTGIQYLIDSLKVIKTGPGKEYVDDELIKKLVGIQPNEMYSAYDRQQAQVRLYRTNFFSSVLINAIVSDTLNPRVPLTINADITTLHEFVPELILNNKENAFNVGFGANYVKRNFYGNARTFTLSGNLAIEDIFKEGVISNLPQFFTINDNNTMGYLDIRATIEQPYLFNESISSKLETYWSENKNNKYTSFTVGSRVSFDIEMPKYVLLNSLNTFYSVEGSSYRFKDSAVVNELEKTYKITSDSARAIIRNINLDNSWDLTSIIGCTIGIHKTDDLLFPTKGYNLSLTVEEANFIPSLLNSLGIGTKPRSLFYRIQTNLSVFPRIYSSPTSSFGIKLKSGYLQTYAGETNWVPLNKRFTAGGSNSIRGWGARELAPKSSSAVLSPNDIYDLSTKDLALSGGTFLLEGSFESRNRLFGQFGMAAFIDYGNVWEGYKSFSIADLAVAVGFGFRFYSSFAPIRLDVGFQAYDPTDKRNFFKKFEEIKKSEGKSFWEIMWSDLMKLHIGIGEAF